MKIIIQLLLIVAILVILVRMWRRTSAGARVGSTLLLILFMTLAVVVILAPDLMSRVANAIGVGRGTDLVLYATVVVVLYMFVDRAISRKEHERRFADAVRQLALLQARLDEALRPRITEDGPSLLDADDQDGELVVPWAASDSDELSVGDGSSSAR
jgi:hypothetical protein